MRLLSSCQIMMYRVGSSRAGEGHQIVLRLPTLKSDAEIPVVVVFRALGLLTDKEILAHVVNDLSDVEMLERFRPSLVEAQPVQDQDTALDYIGMCAGASSLGCAHSCTAL